MINTINPISKDHLIYDLTVHSAGSEVIALPGGGYIYARSGISNGSYDENIIIKVFDNDDNLVGKEVRVGINYSSSEPLSGLHFSYLGGDSFFVNYKKGFSNAEHYVQEYDLKGEKVGDVSVSSSGYYESTTPFESLSRSHIKLSDGSVIKVAHSSERYGKDIYEYRRNEDGETISELVYNLYSSESIYYLDSEPLLKGGYATSFVSYNVNHNSSDGAGIKVIFVDSAGTKNALTAHVAGGETIIVNSQVTVLDNGNVLLSWGETEKYKQYYITQKTKLFSPNGDIVADTKTIDTSDGFNYIGNIVDHTVGSLDDGYIVVWRMYDSGGTYAQIFDNNANQKSDVFEISDYDGGTGRSPHIAVLEDGSFVVYSDTSQMASAYIKHYKSTGEEIQSNSSPVTIKDSITLIEGASKNIDVLLNDFDPDQDALTISHLQYKNFYDGFSAKINKDGTINVTANKNPKKTTTELIYTAVDDKGGAKQGVLEINISEIGGYVYDTEYSASTIQNKTIQIDDIPYDAQIVMATNGTLSLNNQHKWEYTPDDNYFGLDTISFLVRDSSGVDKKDDVIVRINAQSSDTVEVLNSHDSTSAKCSLITKLNDDSYILTWSEYSASGSGLYGKIYFQDGTVSKYPFLISTTSSNYGVMSLNDGGFAVNNNGNLIVYDADFVKQESFRIYNVDGDTYYYNYYDFSVSYSPITGSVTLDSNSRQFNGYNQDSIIKYLNDGVSYIELDTNYDNTFKLELNGSNVNTVISTDLEYKSSPEDAFVLSNDNIVVLLKTTYLTSDLYIQIIDKNFNKLGSVIEVDIDASDQIYDTAITQLNDKGDFVVAWVSDKAGTKDVWSKTFDSMGNAISKTTRINEISFNDSAGVDVEAFSDGDVVYTWTAEAPYSDKSLAVMSKVVAPLYVSATDGSVIHGSSSSGSITSSVKADVFYGITANDDITLLADGIWTAEHYAKNVSNDPSIATNQKHLLEGLNSFSDVIDGGVGVDSLNLTSEDDAFFIDDVYSDIHSSLTLSSTDQGVDSIARVLNLEVVNAGNGNDLIDLSSVNYLIGDITVNAGDGNDTIWSSNGNDVLNGDAGNDILFGGSGDDILTGGTEADTFQFTSTAGSDTITDFSLTDDKIELYYNTGDNHANTDLSLSLGVLTWSANANDTVSIDLTATITSSSLDDIDALITFIEI